MAKKGKGKKKMKNEVIENTAEEAVTEETVQAVAEAIVEEANEQNVDVQEVVQDIIDESNEELKEESNEESDEEKQDTENQEKVVNVKKGIVGGCNKLNVRTEASINSDVACVLNSDSRVYVYLDDSTDEFYKIKTQDDVHGYCKKDFIWLEMNS